MKPTKEEIIEEIKKMKWKTGKKVSVGQARRRQIINSTLNKVIALIDRLLSAEHSSQ